MKMTTRLVQQIFLVDSNLIYVSAVYEIRITGKFFFAGE